MHMQPAEQARARQQSCWQWKQLQQLGTAGARAVSPLLTCSCAVYVYIKLLTLRQHQILLFWGL